MNADAVHAYIAACNREHAECAQELVDALSSNAKVAQLGQRAVPLNDIDLCCIAEAVRAFPADCAVRVLNLEENSFGLQGVTALMEAVEANPGHIRELRLGKNNLKDQTAVAIGHTLGRDGCGLKVLDLSENGITKVGVIPIAAALQSASSDIVELSFHNNRIEGDAAPFLAQAIAGAPKLKHLHLGYNALRDSGAAQLARAIPSARALSTLDLTANRIGHEGGIAIAKALLAPAGGGGGGCTVQRLNLRHNELDSEAIAAFAAVLRGNRSLIQLFLGFMSPTPQVAADVLDAVKNNGALLLLDIYGWKLDAKAALPRLRAVQEGTGVIAAIVTDACQSIAGEIDAGNIARESRDLHPVYVGPDDRDAYLATKSLRRYSRAQSRRQSRLNSVRTSRSRGGGGCGGGGGGDTSRASHGGSSRRRRRPTTADDDDDADATETGSRRRHKSSRRSSRRRSRHGSRAPSEGGGGGGTGPLTEPADAIGALVVVLSPTAAAAAAGEDRAGSHHRHRDHPKGDKEDEETGRSASRHRRRRSAATATASNNSHTNAVDDPAAAGTGRSRSPRSAREPSASFVASTGDKADRDDAAGRQQQREVDRLVADLTERPPCEPKTAAAIAGLVTALQSQLARQRRDHRRDVSDLTARVEVLEARRECCCVGVGGGGSGSRAAAVPFARMVSGMGSSMNNAANSNAFNPYVADSPMNLNAHGINQQQQQPSSSSQQQGPGSAYNRPLSRMSEAGGGGGYDRGMTPLGHPTSEARDQLPDHLPRPNDESGDRRPEETSLQRSASVANFPPRIEPSPAQDANPPRRKSVAHNF